MDGYSPHYYNDPRNYLKYKLNTKYITKHKEIQNGKDSC
jgi:hypothetical protein